jgi:glycerol-3-phosphate acyltransferase PlsY
MLKIIVLASAGYVTGSIPFGYIVARLRGVDLHKIGSGNIGATNVYRAFGLPVALFVFILDVAKGFVATRVFPLLWTTGISVPHMRFICGIAVIVGAVASIFMRFRGGKGVAAAVGVFLALQPLATAICLGIWLILFLSFRYVSLGSVCGAAALPILVAVFDTDGFARNPVFYLSLVVAAIVIVRHRQNIRRLLKGKEHRIRRSEEKA